MGYSGEEGTFPRVTHPSAADARRRPLDLHVLSLPPAFVLSQDQTLKLKGPKTFLTAETSAHQSGSREATRLQTSSSAVHPSSSRDYRKPTNGEADTRIIGGLPPSEPTCKRPVHRNEPNRPHIPSSFISNLRGTISKLFMSHLSWQRNCQEEHSSAICILGLHCVSKCLLPSG